MPIRQPIQTTIHTNDFRDKAYCFVVESILMPQERIGMLTVSVSAGYLLSTSLNKEFKREQAFEHIQQTDGSWIAQGNVTLVVTGDAPINGSIIIRNSIAETIVLPIDMTSTAMQLSRQPSLVVSEQTLEFSQKSTGKPSFQILTLAQQNSDVPVTLTTDAPEYFRLASDSRPAFLPTLTLTPSAVGTHVHVQYFSSKSGTHTGQLTIQNRYDQKTVILEGRSSGLFPTIRKPRPVSDSVTLRSSERPFRAKQWVGLLTLIVLGSLSYMGYTNRCQLFPSLCSAQQQSHATRPTVAVVTEDSARKVMLNTAIVEEVTAKKSTSRSKTLFSRANRSRLKNSITQQDTIDELIAEQRMESELHRSINPRKVTKQNTENQRPDQNRRRKTPTVPTEESDLERALNQQL